MDEEAVAQGEALTERLLLQDEESAEDLAEIERLSSLPYTRFLFDDPESFLADMIEADRRWRAEYAGALLSMSFRTDGRRSGTIERVVDRSSRSFGSVILHMPMRDQEDFWYQDARIMKDMMFAMMDIWDFDWIVAQPQVYVGLQRNLFPDRRSFGWMGWMPELLAETGDALAAVEPVRGGTFMLLQERMMTLKKPDIEACNRAEAHLLDHGVLKTLG